MRLKAIIAYDGTSYCGWQIQKGQPTIQSAIQDGLEQICKKQVDLVGAGRTDSGVHASGQVAHFDWNHPLPPDKLVLALTTLLPGDVRVLSLEPADPDFHARFDAKSKIYLYRINRSRTADPFTSRFSHLFPGSLDLALLSQCAIRIKGDHDFSGFQATGTDVITTRRTVFGVDILTPTSAFPFLETLQPGLLYVRIHATGFLRKMVRLLVGTMLEIGSGKRPLDHLSQALERGNRSLTGIPAPARGLFLEKVIYSEGEVEDGR